jgi:hypothetical protein
VLDQVSHASQYGLDWMVITDHGSVAHAKLGVDKVNPDIRLARAAHPETLVFQGLEWNIPAAEHATVFVAPGSNEVRVLKQFENAYDGVVTNTGASTAANEALAIAGLGFLDRAVRTRQVGDALMLANHQPARASTRRTRSATGATTPRTSRSAWRGRRGTRPPASPRRAVRTAGAAITTSRRRPTRSPATHRSRTGPSAASTG